MSYKEKIMELLPRLENEKYLSYIYALLKTFLDI